MGQCLQYTSSTPTTTITHLRCWNVGTRYCWRSTARGEAYFFRGGAELGVRKAEKKLEISNAWERQRGKYLRNSRYWNDVQNVLYYKVILAIPSLVLLITFILLLKAILCKTTPSLVRRFVLISSYSKCSSTSYNTHTDDTIDMNTNDIRIRTLIIVLQLVMGTVRKWRFF